MQLHRLAMVLGLLAFLPRWAEADEHTQTLAVSGSWVAAAHSENMTTSPDVCIVFNPMQNVAFRSGTDGVEFRVINEKWSLPAEVKGSISIAVGQISKEFEIVENSDKWVAATIPEDMLLPLFAEMDKAATMAVIVGKAKPLSVSLAGSAKATNAFRTCAGIHSNAQTPGSNPFQ